jgi:hypothetical protein
MQTTVETIGHALAEKAQWEDAARIRVYYDVEETDEPIVHVRAVGIKQHNLVRIGGKELLL